MIAKALSSLNKNYLRLGKPYVRSVTGATKCWFSSVSFMDDVNAIVDLDSPNKPKGRLLIVPTPIGNLMDISIRQYEYLLNADIIACEDTRVTGKLFTMLKEKRIRDRFYRDFEVELNELKDVTLHDQELREEEEEFDRLTDSQKKAKKKLNQLDSLRFLNNDYNDDTYSEGLYGIDDESIILLRQKIAELKEKKGRGLLISYFQHNEERRIEKLISLMRYGLRIALVSDAGTPTISDPGYKLVDNCIKEDIYVDSLPGPNAISMALSLSGYPSDRYIFEGYSSKVPSLKVEKLERIKSLELTAVLFESNARLMKSLLTIEKVFGEHHEIFVAFELTKLHQYTIRGPVRELFEKMADIEETKNIKGEITIVVAPYLARYNVSLREQLKEVQIGSEKQQAADEEKRVYPLKSKDLVALLDNKLEASSDKAVANLVADILNISKSKASNMVKQHRHGASKTAQKRMLRYLGEE